MTNSDVCDCQIFKVGGFVRDLVMQQMSPIATFPQSNDIDYVVVGASEAYMVSKGYIKVGADFPVFLHPDTGDEYALARVERKSSAGYHGFEVQTQGVSLEEDLSRRDLTINAIAMNDQGEIVDPYHGVKDIILKRLCHVSDAFREDPVRVLRLARFQARYGQDWQIDPMTQQFVRDIIASGEMDALVSERIWQEIKKTQKQSCSQQRLPDTDFFLFVKFMDEFGLWSKVNKLVSPRKLTGVNTSKQSASIDSYLGGDGLFFHFKLKKHHCIDSDDVKISESFDLLLDLVAGICSKSLDAVEVVTRLNKSALKSSRTSNVFEKALVVFNKYCHLLDWGCQEQLVALKIKSVCEQLMSFNNKQGQLLVENQIDLKDGRAIRQFIQNQQVCIVNQSDLIPQD